jgi:phospholipase C
LSRWRRGVTGDLTSTFNFAAGRRTSVPGLPNPATPAACPSPITPVTAVAGPIPGQSRGKRRRPSGLVKHK